MAEYTIKYRNAVEQEVLFELDTDDADSLAKYCGILLENPNAVPSDDELSIIVQKLAEKKEYDNLRTKFKELFDGKNDKSKEQFCGRYDIADRIISNPELLKHLSAKISGASEKQAREYRLEPVIFASSLLRVKIIQKLEEQKFNLDKKKENKLDDRQISDSRVEAMKKLAQMNGNNKADLAAAFDRAFMLHTDNQTSLTHFAKSPKPLADIKNGAAKIGLFYLDQDLNNLKIKEIGELFSSILLLVGNTRNFLLEPDTFKIMRSIYEHAKGKVSDTQEGQEAAIIINSKIVPELKKMSGQPH